MAYIGRQLARGENKLFDDISSSFNGSTTTFNLTVSSVATATATPYQLFVSLGGVMQKPNTDFTTAGNQITFTTAPAAGLSCWIMMQGDTIDQAAIPDASVSPSKIAGSGDFAFPADVRLKDGDGSHYVGFQAPTTVSTNKIWTLPAADGSANQYLKTDGSGNLSWGSDSTSDPSKMPLAGGTFTGDVTFDGSTAGRDIVFDRSDDALEFADNAKARFGASNDLEIYHSGSESFIADEGTGGITISGGLLSFKNQARDETHATMTVNAGVELYYNNVKTFETLSTGAKIEGHLYMDDDKEIRLGDTGDFQFFHHNSSGEARVYNSNAAGISVISDLVIFKNNASNKTLLTATNGGSIDLYHNNVKKFETSAAGSKFTGGVSQVATAMGALELDLNTSNYFTKTISGNSTFTFANPAASGTVSIFMLELTHSSGTVTWPGTVKWNADTAPTLTTGKTHLFMFVTDDNGSRYRGSALVDYVN